MQLVVTGLRWAGLAGMLVVSAVVMYSQARGAERRQVQAVGYTPKVLRSFWLALALLAPYGAICVALWRPLIAGISPRLRLALAMLGAALYFPGLALTLAARFTLGASHNISSVSGVKLFADHQLVTRGPFAIVRHPMYLGAWAAALGGILMYWTWTLVFIAAHCLVFAVRARREEEALEARFGAEWTAYRSRVPAFIPARRFLKTSKDTSAGRSLR